jgi:hypothetical protein
MRPMKPSTVILPPSGELLAGYKAAGGEIPKEHPILRLVRCDKTKE